MTARERTIERMNAQREAEKHQPDIWERDYFAYWQSFNALFPELIVAERICNADEINPDDVRRLCELAECEFDENNVNASGLVAARALGLSIDIYFMS